MNETTRREFLSTALAGLLAARTGASVLAAQEENPAGVPVRPLGGTGQRVSIVGLGGWHIGAVKDETDAVSIMHQAIDEGMTFFDNCWDYHDGRSEERMGKALSTGGRRDKVFLMTKVCARDYRGALKHLDDSLRRMRTDRIDLWQFHGIQWKDDPELIFDEKDGALAAARKAKKAGKIRFIGFTGHKDPDFHLSMLKRPFDWDTVQMPLNILDKHYRSFAERVLPECNRRKISVIGMKALATGLLAKSLGFNPAVCRRYALSLPITSLMCGITSRAELEQDLAAARKFKPMTEQELRDIVGRTKEDAREGTYEPYKTGNYGCDWHHNQHRKS